MKKGFSIVYAIVIVLAMSLVAVGAYYAGTQKKSNVIPTPTAEPETVGPTVTLTPAVTAAPTVDETTTLKAFIKQTLVAKYGTGAGELNITVSKIEGNYAQGGASGEGGGGMWFAAKVNGQWKLVWDGNGVILCQDLEAYPQFPTDMIPECYNDKTAKSVKR